MVIFLGYPIRQEEIKGNPCVPAAGLGRQRLCNNLFIADILNIHLIFHHGFS
jgi:hypothetical protein